MKLILYILTSLTLIGCNKYQKLTSQENVIDSVQLKEKATEKEESFRYSDRQLESFLDSIGNLPSQPLMDKVAFISDSIFKNQQQLNAEISSSDFEKLKKACKSGKIENETAKKIFGKIEDENARVEKGFIPLKFISFDKNKNNFSEFAVCPNYSDTEWSCVAYFFSGNKIIAKHNIYHRYGLELEHYTDADGKTVVYYKENYESGSGIWWFNFYFYKYYDNKLIPILNELENGNLQFPWGFRVFWLESTITKTNPLTLKMVYYQAFSDSVQSPYFVNNSTFVQYAWDEKSKTLIGNYAKSKISKAKIMTFYVENNELLFINAYYELLKNNLKSKKFRQATLNYLNEVKNQSNK